MPNLSPETVVKLLTDCMHGKWTTTVLVAGHPLVFSRISRVVASSAADNERIEIDGLMKSATGLQSETLCTVVIGSHSVSAVLFPVDKRPQAGLAGALE